MKAIYVDSSVVVSLLLQDGEWKESKKRLEAADEILSSSLLEAEVYSAARRQGLHLSDARAFIKPVSLITPDRSLEAEFEKIFSHDYCRGADAMHLACALYLDPKGSELIFLTADERQGRIAKALGFGT